MSVLELKITTARAATSLKSVFETVGGSRAIAQRISDLVVSVLSGSEGGGPPSIAISIQDNKVAATGSFTFSTFSTANDTIVINGVTFTAVSSGATGNQFNVSLTASGQAIELARVVNASASTIVSSNVSAVGTAITTTGVCTITSTFYGTMGNQCTIAKGTDAGSVVTVSGARLTGGAADATAQTLSF